MALFIFFLECTFPTTAYARPALSDTITATVVGALFGGGTAYFLYDYFYETSDEKVE